MENDSKDGGTKKKKAYLAEARAGAGHHLAVQGQGAVGELQGLAVVGL